MNLGTIAKELHEELKDFNEGNVATYISQLAKVNPELWGICICTKDGQIIEIGDTSEGFTIQSCGKVVEYLASCNLNTKDVVHKHVGKESSGRPFNEHCLNEYGLPHNPLINSGAIMVSSMILPKEEASVRFEYVKDFCKELSGNVGKIGFDNGVYLSERASAYRNFSLAYYMLENGAFPDHVNSNSLKSHLELYFQCCSIQINAKIGAVMSATLANGGINPITGRRVVSREIARDTLSIMFSCGMYDYSGTFSQEIGLPAKSGVSGCIFLTIPKIGAGICIWSPRLDSKGNSARGIEFCRRFAQKTCNDFHAFNIEFKNTYEFEKKNIKVKEHLISAAADNDMKIVVDLVNEFGPNVSDYDKRTPLHLAACRANIDVVKYLLDNSAEPDPHDFHGNTPIHEAKFNLKILLSKKEKGESVDDDLIARYNAIIEILADKIETELGNSSNDE